MAKAELDDVKDRLFWSYANLAMAHSAVESNQGKYRPLNYKIRSRLFRGLMEGSMNIRSIFDDEKIKVLSGGKCSYCGFTEDLAQDHSLPRKCGGRDTSARFRVAG